ncbi:MAG: rhodanese-like domain-containing protein [Dehalococcoidales bacterium]|nr:rhodanese-like domain-containing protein [Dehalococcoidales bacterium]
MDVNETPRISCEELKQLMDRGEKVVVIDTRDSASYEAEHISGAVNIYYDPSGNSMERDLMLSGLPPDSVLVPYCDCEGDTTSALMVNDLANLCFDSDKIKALKDGITRWRELDYPMD